MVRSSLGNRGRSGLYYGIAEISVTNGIKEKNKKKKTETENHRAVKPEPPVQPAISAKPVVRGYDSRDLFWEDALIRIREVRRKIASDLKKED